MTILPLTLPASEFQLTRSCSLNRFFIHRPSRILQSDIVLAGGVLTLVGPLASSRPTQVPSLLSGPVALVAGTMVAVCLRLERLRHWPSRQKANGQKANECRSPDGTRNRDGC